MKINGSEVFVVFEEQDGFQVAFFGERNCALSMEATFEDVVIPTLGPRWERLRVRSNRWKIDFSGFQVNDPEKKTDAWLAENQLTEKILNVSMRGSYGIDYVGRARAMHLSRTAGVGQPVTFSAVLRGIGRLYQFFYIVSARISEDRKNIIAEFSAPVFFDSALFTYFRFHENEMMRFFVGCAAGPGEKELTLLYGNNISLDVNVLLTYTPGEVRGSPIGVLKGFVNFPVQLGGVCGCTLDSIVDSVICT